MTSYLPKSDNSHEALMPGSVSTYPNLTIHTRWSCSAQCQLTQIRQFTRGGHALLSVNLSKSDNSHKVVMLGSVSTYPNQTIHTRWSCSAQCQLIQIRQFTRGAHARPSVNLPKLDNSHEALMLGSVSIYPN